MTNLSQRFIWLISRKDQFMNIDSSEYEYKMSRFNGSCLKSPNYLIQYQKNCNKIPFNSN